MITTEYRFAFFRQLCWHMNPIARCGKSVYRLKQRAKVAGSNPVRIPICVDIYMNQVLYRNKS